jgi:hypothetical protein
MLLPDQFGWMVPSSGHSGMMRRTCQLREGAHFAKEEGSAEKRVSDSTSEQQPEREANSAFPFDPSLGPAAADRAETVAVCTRN